MADSFFSRFAGRVGWLAIVSLGVLSLSAQDLSAQDDEIFDPFAPEGRASDSPTEGERENPFARDDGASGSEQDPFETDRIGTTDSPDGEKTERDPAAEAAEREKYSRLRLYMKGRFLYHKQCAVCHGESGKGDGPWAAELRDKPRDFRSGLFKFRTTPYGTLPTEDDLRRTIRSGISGTAMPFFAHFTEEDVTALITYLQGLSRKWRDEELRAEPIEIPNPPQWFATRKGREEHAEQGAVLFATNCAVCHGPGGAGNGPGGKGLVDAWGHPIIPADLTAEHHKSGDAPADLYRTIATGLNGTPMIGFAQQLDEDRIWDLVAYIQSLPHSGEEGQSTTSDASESEKP